MRLFRAITLAGVLAVCATAQTATPIPAPNTAALEQRELDQLVGEAGNSPVDLIRALEKFLGEYPETKKRAEIEKALAKSAIEINDSKRILLYGEIVLQTSPDDVQLLDRVIRELIAKNDAESAKKALVYANRYEQQLARLKDKPPGHLTPGQWSEQLNRGQARILALKAQATGNAGDVAGAAKLARDSWANYPTGEGAREAAGWLAKLGDTKEAIDYYADGFTLEDPGSTEVDRGRDRKRMGELYTKLNGSEKGLGDVILQAYDRTSALMHARLANLKQKDPNASAIDLFDFVLPSPEGEAPLALSTLKGKTIVMDIWATWCIPCRAQHPLIEKVKTRYVNNPNVVFLAVDADDDPSLVVPFMKQQGWKGPVWLEDGLERRLAITSIPTLLVLDPAGQITSRMMGLIPERFEDMLTQRIEEARNHPAVK